MELDTVWGHIDARRARLADLLEGLPDESWQVPSLCAGWRVRDVAAHLTLAQARVRDVLPWLLRTGSYNAMVRQSAVHLGAGRDEIVATLRSFVGSRRTAPFVTPLEPLVDILVHTQDICVPLGIDELVPPEAATAAAERVVALNDRPLIRLRPPLRGVRLVATDTAWEWGEGRVVRGEARWLLLALAGREAALERLTGEVEALVR